MIKVISNYQNLEKDLNEITSLFSIYAGGDITLNLDILLFEKSMKSIIRYESVLFEENCAYYLADEIKNKRQIKKFAKSSLYKALKAILKVDMPFGSITGVRPCKVASDILKDESISIDDLLTELTVNQNVSEKKAKLIVLTLINEPKTIQNDKLLNLYINIPFCKTRCSYCSFISAEVKDENCELLQSYMTVLIKELVATKKFIYDNGYIVKTIYIGGGTPTVLSCELLEKLLSECSYPVKEFTVEAGRVDTITDDKLKVMKKYGVTRISINPQSFNTKALKEANRNISIDKILEVYKLALKYGFDINMDVIAGLDGDNFAGFKKTINTLLDFYPENISVHTLSVKNGSDLALAKMLENEAKDLSKQKNDASENQAKGITKPNDDLSEKKLNEIKLQDQIRAIEIEKMIDYSQEKLFSSGYRPYYMYKLKNTARGLENVGFCRDGKACVFNVDSMENKASTIAVGANAVSKRVYFDRDGIDRQFNPKDIKTYKEKVDICLDEKFNLFKN